MSTTTQLPRICLTHAAIVTCDGDTDVTLAPSEEIALAYLRDRAGSWEAGDYPLLEHGLDPRTLTAAQLSWIYADGEPDDTTHIVIGRLPPIWVAIAALDPFVAASVATTPLPDRPPGDPPGGVSPAGHHGDDQ